MGMELGTSAASVGVARAPNDQTGTVIVLDVFPGCGAQFQSVGPASIKAKAEDSQLIWGLSNRGLPFIDCLPFSMAYSSTRSDSVTKDEQDSLKRLTDRHFSLYTEPIAEDGHIPRQPSHSRRPKASRHQRNKTQHLREQCEGWWLYDNVGGCNGRKGSADETEAAERWTSILAQTTRV